MKTSCTFLLLLICNIYSFAQTREKVIAYNLPKYYEIILSDKIKGLKKHLKKDDYIGFRINHEEIDDSSFNFSIEPWVYTYQNGYIYGLSYYDNNGIYHFNESSQRLLLDSKRFVLINEILYPIWFETDKYSAMGNYCRYRPDSFGHKDSLYHYYVNYSMKPDTLKIHINLNNNVKKIISDSVFVPSPVLRAVEKFTFKLILQYEEKTWIPSGPARSTPVCTLTSPLIGSLLTPKVLVM